MIKTNIAIALFSLICFGSQAQRKYSNEFLSIGVGARSLAMGNTQVASANDVTAVFYNPAGLYNIKNDMQIGFMHSEYFAGIAKYDYAALATPISDGNRVLSFSLLRLGVDDIPNTLQIKESDGSFNYDKIVSFSAADYAFFTSFAQEIYTKGMSVGGSAKIIHRRAGKMATAWGFGLDLGWQYNKENWIFGIMAKDVTSTFNAWSFNFTEADKIVLSTTGNEIPKNSLEITMPTISAGAAYNFKHEDKFNLLTEIDLDITTDGKRNVLINTPVISFQPRLGIEAGYQDFIYLRGGINNIQRSLDNEDGTEKILTLQPNIGAGVKIGQFNIDYALTNVTANVGLYSHVVSLRIDIDKKSNKRRR